MTIKLNQMKKKQIGLIILTVIITQFSAIAGIKTMTTKQAKEIDAAGRGIHIGDTVLIQGICQSQNFAATGGGGGGGNFLFSLGDTSSGIFVTRRRAGGGGGGTTARMPNYAEGVKVYGRITPYTIRIGGGGGGTTDSTGDIVIAADSIIVVTSANTIKNPTKVSALIEKHEGDYTELDSFRMVNTADWKKGGTTGGNANFALITIYKNGNKNDTAHLRVTNTIIGNMTAPNGLFNVKGITFQYDKKAPFTEDYYLMPTDTSDFVQLTSTAIPLAKIKDIHHTNSTTGVEDSIGALKRIRGIVQSYNFSLSNGLEFSVYDNTGAIIVYNTTANFGYGVHVGDSVEIKGNVNQISTAGGGGVRTTGFTDFEPISITVLNRGNATKAVIPVKLLEEKNEGDYVQLNSYFLSTPSVWDTTGTTFGGRYRPKTQIATYIKNNAGDSFLIVVNRFDSSAWWKPRPSGYFNISGIQGQNDRTAPLFGNYYLLVKDYKSIVPVNYGLPTKLISDVTPNTTNGSNIAASQATRCYLKGVSYSPNVGGHKAVVFTIEDKSGAIAVVQDAAVTYSPKTGDSLKVRGTIIQVNGMAYIKADSIGVISTWNKQSAPNVITFFKETEEAYHRQIKGVKMVNPAQWDTTGGYANNGFLFKVIDTVTTDTFGIWVPYGIDAWGAAKPRGGLNISGVIFQNDPTAPYSSNYYMVVRNYADIQQFTGIENQVGGKSKINVFPNPSNGNWNVTLQSGFTSSAYRLLDLQGRLLNTANISGTNSFQVQNDFIQSGVYLLQIIDNNGKVVNTIQVVKGR